MSEKQRQKYEAPPIEAYSDDWYDAVDTILNDLTTDPNLGLRDSKGKLVPGWYNLLADEVDNDYTAVLNKCGYFPGDDDVYPEHVFIAAKFAALAPAYRSRRIAEDNTQSREHVKSICAFNHAAKDLLLTYPDISKDDFGKLFASSIFELGGMIRTASAERHLDELADRVLRGVMSETAFDQAMQFITQKPDSGVSLIRTTIDEDIKGIDAKVVFGDTVVPVDVKSAITSLPAPRRSAREYSRRVGVRSDGLVVFHVPVTEKDTEGGCCVSPRNLPGFAENIRGDLDSILLAYQDFQSEKRFSEHLKERRGQASQNLGNRAISDIVDRPNA